ncbi:DUF6009 family protein [Streptomyces goshikiensis]|uniref:DUF6009 family protein n=1 Tax=Streptomyces goshikiensis TaxID=1942 RepID=UPI0036AF3C5E
MRPLISDGEIHHEADPVRLEDITGFDYVRQSLDRLPARRGRPAHHRDGRLAGYAQLSAKAKPSRSGGTFRRRVFWVLPPTAIPPPTTSAARSRGRTTERSERPAQSAGA